MGWTAAEAASAPMEYVLELAADMVLEAQSVKSTSSTPGRPAPGQAIKYVSKKE